MFSPVSSIVLDYTQVLQIHYTITDGAMSLTERVYTHISNEPLLESVN